MEKIQNHWSIHMEFAVMLVTLIGGFYTLDSKIERQGARTDKLYEMYCEMRKEIHQEMAEMRKDHHQEMAEMRKDHHEEMKEIYKHWST